MIRLAVLLAALAAPAAAELAVTARSVGYVTRCAEMDNVLVALESAEVRRFEVRATLPAYIAGMEGDSMAADFTDCVFPEEPIWRFTDNFSTTLWEDERILLLGHRLKETWRPEEVSFRVGGRRVNGLHLTQLHVKLDGRPVEVLVLYPNDGYWRPKPLPPVGREDTGFGSSILMGPIEIDRRPLVKITEVDFEPATLTYRLRFANGGTGSVRVASVARGEIRLEVAFDAAVTGVPFAMISSMHVAPDNADVARVGVRPAGEAIRRDVAIDALDVAVGAEFAFGRDVPSRHNFSAPDVSFGAFRAQ